MLIPDSDHPLRPVDWRYRRADHLTCSGKQVTRRDDSWIRQSVRYLRRLRHCGQIGGLHRLAQRMPVVHYAHRRFQRRTNARTWTLEARLLAGESDDQIAAKCGLAPAVVECYEAVYFNVREMLDCPDYIQDVVIPQRDLRGTATLAWTVKRLAYEHGPILLDRLLGHLAHPQPCVETRVPLELNVLRECAGELQCRLALQANLGSGTRPTLDRLRAVQQILDELNADLDVAAGLQRNLDDGLPVGAEISCADLEHLRDDPEEAAAETGLLACA